MTRRWLLWMLGVCTALPAAATQPACSADSGARLVPLVELYTSEGCSSCPPADRWLSKTAAADHGDANYLAFHVDYWDELGWHDRFGSPLYSRRQRQRVAYAGGGTTVYTPQVMTGSNVRANWRDPAAFAGVLRAAAATPGATLGLRMQPQAGRWNASVRAAIAAGAPHDAQLWLAEYVDGQSTQVRAGENGGATLHHDRVVRHLWGPWPVDAQSQAREVAIVPPASPWGLTAFVQDAHGRTLQSLRLPATACATAR